MVRMRTAETEEIAFRAIFGFSPPTAETTAKCE